MEILFLLIPLSLVLVIIVGTVFWWSLRNGQYDDLEGPAYRLMMDDKDLPPEKEADVPKSSSETERERTV